MLNRVFRFVAGIDEVNQINCLVLILIFLTEALSFFFNSLAILDFFIPNLYLYEITFLTVNSFTRFVSVRMRYVLRKSFKT